MHSATTDISVLIVDDEPFFGEALTRYLEKYEGIKVLGVSEDGVQALDMLQKVMADVVLCDVRMPRMDGVQFAKVVAAEKLPCRVVGLTTFDDERSMLEMLNAGCFGFILKSARPDEIVEAVRGAASGGTTISPQSATRLRRYLVNLPEPSASHLPDREWEVLSLLQKGGSNAAIADELRVSEASVKKAVTRLMQRYDVSSRLELVVTTRDVSR